MSTTNTNTVAFARQEAAEGLKKVKAELDQKCAEFDAVKADIEVKTKELEAKTAQDAEHTAQIKALADENTQLRKAVEALEERLAAPEPPPESERPGELQDKADLAGLIRIVALPPNPDVKVLPLVRNGKRCLTKKDADGFHYFAVERDHAEALLTAESGMKYALVGPDAKMTVRRSSGLRNETMEVFKHVKSKTSTGQVFWQPVIEEESPEPKE